MLDKGKMFTNSSTIVTYSGAVFTSWGGEQLHGPLVTFNVSSPNDGNAIYDDISLPIEAISPYYCSRLLVTVVVTATTTTTNSTQKPPSPYATTVTTIRSSRRRLDLSAEYRCRGNRLTVTHFSLLPLRGRYLYSGSAVAVRLHVEAIVSPDIPLAAAVLYELFVSADDRLQRDFDTPVSKSPPGVSNWAPVADAAGVAGVAGVGGRVNVSADIVVSVPRSSCLYGYAIIELRLVGGGGGDDAPGDDLENDALSYSSAGLRCSHFEFDLALGKRTPTPHPAEGLATLTLVNVLAGDVRFPSDVDFAYFLSADERLDPADTLVHSSSIGLNRSADVYLIPDPVQGAGLMQAAGLNNALCGWHFLLLAVDVSHRYEERFTDNNVLSWRRYTGCAQGLPKWW